jgi:hypothetical protein
MRLSEAIRLGSMLHPQYFGSLFCMRIGKEILASCALGAAIEATGTNNMKLTFPYLAELVVPPIRMEHIFDLGVKYELANAIAHLNDYARWTREDIADWVERLENENGWGIDPTIEENQCESELSENQASPAIATG